MTLIGKLIHQDVGDGYRTGVIVEEIGAFLLVQYDAMNGGDVTMPAELIPLAAMAERSKEGIARVSFFNTRAELKAWVAWLETPAKEEEGRVKPLNRMH
jgi:hypothetical protein